VGSYEWRKGESNTCPSLRLQGLMETTENKVHPVAVEILKLCTGYIQAKCGNNLLDALGS